MVDGKRIGNARGTLYRYVEGCTIWGTQTTAALLFGREDDLGYLTRSGPTGKGGRTRVSNPQRPCPGLCARSVALKGRNSRVHQVQLLRPPFSPLAPGESPRPCAGGGALPGARLCSLNQHVPKPRVEKGWPIEAMDGQLSQ